MSEILEDPPIARDKTVKTVTTESLTREERETFFNHDEMSDKWICETSERIMKTKLKRAGWTLIEEGYSSKGNWVYGVYEAPFYALSVRSAVKIKKEISDEQRQALSVRLSDARNRRRQDTQTG